MPVSILVTIRLVTRAIRRMPMAVEHLTPVSYHLMNIEFHYYALYALALEAGFDDRTAFILAQSSQEVDASTTNLAFDCSGRRVEIAITQNYLFWDDAVKRNVYLPFHFMPGNADAAASLRIDGLHNGYTVTPNSDAVKTLLIDAFKDKNPYLMGIAAHTFADSWAHQNFCGLSDAYNSIANSSIQARLPPAGHLQALTAPDEPDAIWMDPRLHEKKHRIVNRERFAAAAMKLFRYFRVYLGKPFNDDELVVARLEAIWAKASRDERIADYIICWNLRPYEPGLWRRQAGAAQDHSALAGLRGYDKLAWVKSRLSEAAGLPQAEPIPTDSSFLTTDLYRWHEAAIEHRNRAWSILERNGL